MLVGETLLFIIILPKHLMIFNLGTKNIIFLNNFIASYYKVFAQSSWISSNRVVIREIGALWVMYIIFFPPINNNIIILGIINGNV